MLRQPSSSGTPLHVNNGAVVVVTVWDVNDKVVLVVVLAVDVVVIVLVVVVAVSVVDVPVIEVVVLVSVIVVPVPVVAVLVTLQESQSTGQYFCMATLVMGLIHLRLSTGQSGGSDWPLHACMFVGIVLLVVSDGAVGISQVPQRALHFLTTTEPVNAFLQSSRLRSSHDTGSKMP